MSTAITPIDHIAFHSYVHIEEAAGRVLLEQFAQDRYPGIENADNVFWGCSPGETPDGRSADEYEREGVLAIGVGGGWADEHRDDAGYNSSVMLIALELGFVDSDGEITESSVKRLIPYTHRVDSQGGDEAFGAGTLMKHLHRLHEGVDEIPMQWALDALRGHVALERQGHKWITDEKQQHAFDEAVAAAFVRWFVDIPGIDTAGIRLIRDSLEGCTVQKMAEDDVVVHLPPEGSATEQVLRSLQLDDVEERSLRQIRQYCGRVYKKGEEKPFNLFQLYNAVREYYPEDPGVAQEWLRMALEAKYAEQEDFVQATERVKNATTDTVQDGTVSEKIVYITDDHDLIHKAAFSAGAALAVVRRSSGQVHIFRHSRSKVVTDERMLDLAKHLRLAEMRERGIKKRLPDSRLKQEGRLEIVPNWYVLNTTMILNGSKSAPNVEPTGLSKRQIRNIVSRVLGIS